MPRPEMLLTYVNYPPTEFLELPFSIVHAFNVYLHDEERHARLRARLAAPRRTQSRSCLAECGADSQRHGEEGQASARLDAGAGRASAKGRAAL